MCWHLSHLTLMDHGWIGRTALTEAVDAYMAGSLSDGRARLSGPSTVA